MRHEIKIITKCKNITFEFNIDPLRHLMKSCNNEARRVEFTISNRISISNVSYFVKWSMSINDSGIERPAQEAVRMSDEIASEKIFN